MQGVKTIKKSARPSIRHLEAMRDLKLSVATLEFHLTVLKEEAELGGETSSVEKIVASFEDRLGSLAADVKKFRKGLQEKTLFG